MKLLFKTSLGKRLSINLTLAKIITQIIGIPHLGTRIRAKLLFQSLKRLNAKPGMKILDAGCGYGFISLELNRLGYKVVGVDNDIFRLNVARELAKRTDNSLQFANATIYKLPFKNTSFNIVVCLDVLEHLQDDLKTLQELVRVTKRHGYIIISFPDYEANRSGFEKFKHLRSGYSINHLVNLTSQAGLRLIYLLPYGKTSFGKSALFIDYQLMQISPVLSILIFPLLYPLLISEQHLPFSSNPWNYLAVLAKAKRR